MESNWSIYSNHDRESKEWTSATQIVEPSMLVENNVFGISFIVRDNGDKTDKTYDIEDVRVNMFNNGYYSLMEDYLKIDMDWVLKRIEQQLRACPWTSMDLEQMINNGIVNGISKKLMPKDRPSNHGTNDSMNFLSDQNIQTMQRIENFEFYHFRNKTDEERLAIIEKRMKQYGDKSDDVYFLMYRKYKDRVKAIKKTEKTKESNAQQIVYFCKEKGFTSNDLALALSMMQATRGGAEAANDNVANGVTPPQQPEQQ